MASICMTSRCQYDVTFQEDDIIATVTHSAAVVGQWLSTIHQIHHRRLHKLIVGLDVEWRPNYYSYVTNPIAVLQLCVGRRCLIFQIRHCDVIPRCLISFLKNDSYTFVGVGIKEDVNKLFKDYELWVVNTIDLRILAAEKMGMEELKRAGLKKLALEVLDKEVEKPHHIATSNWDNLELSNDQVYYACIDGFLSFEIGRTLISEYH